MLGGNEACVPHLLNLGSRAPELQLGDCKPQILKPEQLELLCPSIRRQNASGRLWAKAPMVGGGAGFLIRIPKKGNAKECSNYRTVALTSHTSK